jgi:membrane protein YdbS with pleckstrin-like domain
MSERVQQATEWIYQGIWRVLVEWFRVPKEPPTLPVEAGASIETFRPAPGFLRYMKFWFWLVLLPVDFGILIAWLALVVGVPWLGVLLAPVAFVLAVVPDVIVYVGLHLRYDTTWYVMTPRSLRLRRGVWVIREVTITFENVQNIRVSQGPLQRHFGIADVIVETAGGGGDAHQKGFQVTNRGLIEGISNPEHIRGLIMAQLRESRSAGLGDDLDEPTAAARSWSPRHVAVLREIRHAVAEFKAPTAKMG